MTLQQVSRPPRPPPVLPPQSRLQQALHAANWQPRIHILQALADDCSKSGRSRLQRMAACASTARLQPAADGSGIHPTFSRCRDRLCPFCARSRSTRVAKQILTNLRSYKEPRQVVLTVRSTDQPLAVQLAFLRDSFAKLRRLPEWKRNVTRGCYTLECTRNEKTGRWHPHLHIVYEGSYWAQANLRYLWHQVTGDADIVWIGAVKDLVNMAAELAKYIGKPQRVADWPAEAIRDYAAGIKSVRMVQAFGKKNPTVITDTDKEHEAPSKLPAPSIAEVVHNVTQGSQAASGFLQAIIARYPIFNRYACLCLPYQEPALAQVIRSRTAHIQPTHPPPLPRLPSPAPEIRPELDAALWLAYLAYTKAFYPQVQAC